MASIHPPFPDMMALCRHLLSTLILVCVIWPWAAVMLASMDCSLWPSPRPACIVDLSARLPCLMRSMSASTLAQLPRLLPGSGLAAGVIPKPAPLARLNVRADLVARALHLIAEGLIDSEGVDG